MFKKTARSQQYFALQGNYATRISPKGYRPIGGGNPLTFSAIEERESLARKVVAIDAELQTLLKRDPKRRELGLRKFELQNQINTLHPKCKLGRGVNEHFMDVARERLTPGQFKQFMDEASRRLKMLEVFDDVPQMRWKGVKS